MNSQFTIQTSNPLDCCLCTFKAFSEKDLEDHFNFKHSEIFGTENKEDIVRSLKLSNIGPVARRYSGIFWLSDINCKQFLFL